MEDIQAKSRVRVKELIAADPRMAAWEEIIDAYRNRSPERFDKAVAALAAFSSTVPQGKLARSRFEVFFNHFEPFYSCTALYVVAFILGLAAVLTGVLSPTFSAPFRWSALGIAALSFGIHTFGLIARMYIQNRPPVTNLYSSAIFIGWGGVLFGEILEFVYRRGIAVAIGGLLGLSTTIVAHGLGTNDTMEMMQAVLDTNFWLATHVVIVTLGYMATFLAGLIGMAYIGFGVFSPFLNRDLSKSLGQMIYGVLCAATLMSFTGTVLGGIWADQSWGRFWGWDPKENGALLIVMWNAIVLHARWGGMVKQRGVAVLAVFGSIVTAWSWFGTNMLGVGLHSYGFMDGTKFWLGAFWVLNLVFMCVGMVPPRYWLSTIANAPPAPQIPPHAKLRPKLA